MGSSIIISEMENGNLFFTEILAQNSIHDVIIANNGSKARRMMAERDFDICIINAPLKDEFGDELSISIAEKYNCQVILVVRADISDDISEKVEDFGVITVAKPINRKLFWNVIKLAIASQRRLNMMQKENNKLLKRIEDIRIIDRAKCVLISYLNMSENEAHKYIEKQAMDMRMTRRQVSENILKMYDN